jgi:hypothetical protein
MGKAEYKKCNSGANAIDPYQNTTPKILSITQNGEISKTDITIVCTF